MQVVSVSGDTVMGMASQTWESLLANEGNEVNIGAILNVDSTSDIGITTFSIDGTTCFLYQV